MSTSPSNELKQQWRTPTDILSVLLLIGGNIVQMALAQLSGSHIVPVAFSFGWAAYSFTALMSVIGDRKLMPPTDCPSIVIETTNGFVRSNNSWILGRLLRDLEVKHVVERRGAPLWVRVYGACDPNTPRARGGLLRSLIRDWVWTMGIITVTLQFGIAAIPWVLHGNWAVLVVTAAGTTMAFVCGALPQWRREKWACRRNWKGTAALTRGNGSRLVVVIYGNGVGLNLSDLASGRVILAWGTREVIAVLALLWLALLVTVSGLRKDTWYFMGIGLLGMMQNVTAAGASRSPEDFGMPIQFYEEFSSPKVMKTLQSTEIRYPGVGAALLPVFFPGVLRKDEHIWWSAMKDKSREEESDQKGLSTAVDGETDRVDAGQMIEGVTNEERAEGVTNEETKKNA
ncbi:hypothetical protein Hypma_001366 [Hypsizygus marmoreus]|uniref:Uncharacterized protein n=1 Tax=Hypsizygus marmoreus TaxID=39966 RepID=A0A369K8C2_HYPMA|nr:hypothetical protein Hypma_001366 [Hypsizygus marmoreus]